MRPLAVVVLDPFLGHAPHLFYRPEYVGVEHVLAVAPVEALHERVLIWLAGLDVAWIDAMLSTPLLKRVSREFGPVVHTQRSRCSVGLYQLVQDSHHPHARDRGCHLDRQDLAVPFVDHVQGPDLPPAVECIRHEVERPNLIQSRRRRQRLPQSCRHPSPRAPGQMELERAIDSTHTLVVPGPLLPSQSLEALPEAGAWPLL